MKTKLVHALLFVLLLSGSSASLFARGFSGNCSGTYLMAEAGGATTLWTLEADGSFFATSSLQPLLNFRPAGELGEGRLRRPQGGLLALVFETTAAS